MKELAQTLLRESKWDLEKMQVSKMTLTERVKYEKAMVRLELLNTVLNKLQNPL